MKIKLNAQNLFTVNIYFLISCRNKDADRASLPESYKSNTPKEKLLLSFCENFRRQFVHLYRDRKPLFLNPVNECGIEVTRQGRHPLMTRVQSPFQQETLNFSFNPLTPRANL